MRRIDLFRRLDLLRRATLAAEGWQFLAEVRERQLLEQELESARHFRNMLEHFLIMLDDPARMEEARPYMIEGLKDMRDHVARLEEHVE